MDRREDTQAEQTMSPLVQEALAHLRHVPKPDPERWEEAREAYLVEARAFASERENMASQRDHNDKGAGLRVFLLPLWERRQRTMLARLIIMLGIVLSSGVGSVRATQSSLPGSALYPVKLRVEELRIAWTQTTEQQIARTLESAQRRVDEAKRLVERGDDVPGSLVERYIQRLSTASRATRSLTGSARSRVQAEVARELTSQAEAIRALQASSDDESGGLGAMMAAIDDAASALDHDIGDVDDDGVGEDDDDIGEDDHDDADDDYDDDTSDDDDDDDVGEDDDDTGDDDGDDDIGENGDDDTSDDDDDDIGDDDDDHDIGEDDDDIGEDDDDDTGDDDDDDMGDDDDDDDIGEDDDDIGEDDDDDTGDHDDDDTGDDDDDDGDDVDDDDDGDDRVVTADRTEPA